VPPGAIITSANIQFTANETNSEPTVLAIHVEAADYASRFDSNKLSGRVVVGKQRALAAGPLVTAGESNALQRTPDLTPLVQEIVSRPRLGQGQRDGLFLPSQAPAIATADALTEPAATPHG